MTTGTKTGSKTCTKVRSKWCAVHQNEAQSGAPRTKMDPKTKDIYMILICTKIGPSTAQTGHGASNWRLNAKWAPKQCNASPCKRRGAHQNASPKRRTTHPKSTRKQRSAQQNRAQNDALHTKSNTAHQNRSGNSAECTKLEPKTAHRIPKASPKRRTSHQNLAQNSAPRTNLEPKTAHRAPKSSPKQRVQQRA